MTLLTSMAKCYKVQTSEGFPFFLSDEIGCCPYRHSRRYILYIFSVFLLPICVKSQYRRSHCFEFHLQILIFPPRKANTLVTIVT